MFLPTLLQSNLQKGLFHLYSQTIKICSAGYAVPLRKCTRTAGDTKERRCGVLVFRGDVKLLIEVSLKIESIKLHSKGRFYLWISSEYRVKGSPPLESINLHSKEGSPLEMINK